MTDKEQKPAFAKSNVLLIGIGLVFIIIGFLLMLGTPNQGAEFNPDIFSFRRLTLGPMIALAGFLFIIYAIFKKPKKQDKKG